ncbi:PREDICTED: uncharacterized protein LOC109340407 isoform X1 [Lupinus angustifolius]|uniref:uncharacterized protein LOC109340407 isoform X1 n=1 Tax=Lupinus angustifolius TaxID=3871 RepID=UPI00092FB237|nr:PREDICTED: uncharacterized protein LOC109340407 isoform X1 [Lupinus angustifolius]XP_019433641.1 PREDICTED: uncharacterized protein LOC109340407 isoform X1 [Lupinus angustifolius]XP_019433642.1 PREDICTED: uncharacterized protein LOC109340407 isoform X1 [Lupinus angustifolius]
MQKGRGIQENIFESRGFGLHRNVMSMPSIFCGKDPFDDPFFNDPFHQTMFGPRTMQNTSREKGVVIEELGSDDEGGNHFAETGNNEDFVEPSIEHPDDDYDDVNGNAERKNSDATYKNAHQKIEPPKVHNFSSQTSRVTYGGVDGAYYTSTRTTRIGVDGVVIEENKEADSTTGQATHRITRGIKDKVLSVLKKLDSDGKVDTSHTLQNLSEDELEGFEEEWKGNNIGQLPEWKGRYAMHRNEGSGSSEQNRNQVWTPFPSFGQAGRATGFASNYETGSNASGGTKKVVRINIE